MHESAGQTLGEMKPDLMPLTCAASARSYGLYGHKHSTNCSIRSRTRQPQLTAVIRKRRLQWFGQIQRMDMDRIPKKLYLWKPAHGKRKPGRPKTFWQAVIQKEMDLGWTVEEAEVEARERIM